MRKFVTKILSLMGVNSPPESAKRILVVRRNPEELCLPSYGEAKKIAVVFDGNPAVQNIAIYPRCKETHAVCTESLCREKGCQL